MLTVIDWKNNLHNLVALCEKCHHEWKDAKLNSYFNIKETIQNGIYNLLYTKNVDFFFYQFDLINF